MRLTESDRFYTTTLCRITCDGWWPSRLGTTPVVVSSSPERAGLPRRSARFFSLGIAWETRFFSLGMCRTSRLDLGVLWPSRLVATAEEARLSFWRNDADRCPLSLHKRRTSGHFLNP